MYCVNIAIYLKFEYQLFAVYLNFNKTRSTEEFNEGCLDSHKP